MMEKKNLDRLFQEQFRDFEATPPTDMWPRIEAELNRKKKRRVIPLWYKLSGVAALLIIGLGLFTVLNDDKTTTANPVVVNPNPTEDGQTPIGIDSVPNSEQLQNIAPRTESVAQTPGAENGTNSSTADNANASSDGSVNQSPDSDPGSNQRRPSSDITSDKINGSTKSVIATTESNEKEKREKLLYTGSGGAKEKAQPSSQLPIKKPNASGVAGVKTESESADPTRNKSKTRESAFEQKNTSIAQSAQKNGQNQTQKNISEKPFVADPNTIIPASEQHAVVQAQAEPQPDSTAVATVEPNALEELLNEKENKVTASEQKINRWQITSSVAPIYFSSVSNGSPIDSRLVSANKTYKPSVSYGAGVSYAVNKRLSVRTGVNSLAFEYSTNDLVFFQTQDARPLENVKPNQKGSLLEIDKNPGMLSMANLESRPGGKRFDGSLNQRTGYIEVPVEMSYKLIDRKFSVNVTGGFSTLFLNENTVELESTGLNMAIGEAENLSKTHFSTNVGVGFRYTFLKSFEANFEPMFKYQLNMYSNNAGNFKPYFFGLYTGLSYRF